MFTVKSRQRTDDQQDDETIFFSTCGTYLASQGEGPDFNLTVWLWSEELKVAEKQSPASDHSQVVFAYDNHCRITTCGNSTSFAGFKLQINHHYSIKTIKVDILPESCY